MTYNTAVRRSVLSSLKLKKTIVSEEALSQVIVGGEIQNRAKTIYRASVDDDTNEYNDITVCGYSELDVFKKLNTNIINRFKKNHPADYETICKTAKVNVDEE